GGADRAALRRRRVAHGAHGSGRASGRGQSRNADQTTHAIGDSVMDAGLIINAVVIALLAATIFYAFRLERRLSSLRNAQAALADVIRELNAAAARAEAGIQGLKFTAESSGQA